MREFRSRFGIPISDEDIAEAPFYQPGLDSPEMEYLQGAPRRAGRASAQPRPSRRHALELPPRRCFEELLEGTGDREVSTTMVFVRMLSKLLRDKELGKLDCAHCAR